MLINEKDKGIVQTCLRLSAGLTKLSGKHLWIDYDQEADVLYLSFRKPQNATETIEIEEGLLVRTDGDELVGLTIMNARAR